MLRVAAPAPVSSHPETVKQSAMTTRFDKTANEINLLRIVIVVEENFREARAVYAETSQTRHELLA